jgi:hypothetical protein
VIGEWPQFAAFPTAGDIKSLKKRMKNVYVWRKSDTGMVKRISPSFGVT